MDRIKYPRTYHLPWSLGSTSDDKFHHDISFFYGQEVVVSEKADGENTTIYHDGFCHARSCAGNPHPSRNRVKAMAKMIANDLPENWRICGENTFAKHAILYSSLPDYFLAFSIWTDKNECLSWDDFVEWCDLLNIQHVPVLYRGIYDEEKIKAAWNGVSAYGPVSEGYVIRLARGFKYEDFSVSVGKFVRRGHVLEGSDHWLNKPMEPNGIMIE